MHSAMTIALGGALAASLAATSALAGGFQRGMPDTDILYENGTFSMRQGVTVVDPQRGFESINGQSGDFGDYAQTYTIPSFATYFGGEYFGCAVHYTESFAAEADYTGSPGGALPRQVSSTQSTDNADRLNFLNSGAQSRTRTIAFESNEFGSTCRASYSSEIGRFSLLGGVFFEDLSFQGSSIAFRNLNPLIAGLDPAAVAGLNAIGAQISLPTQINTDNDTGYSTGYRIGAAYERREIALRAQVMYRSEVVHEDITGSGTVRVTDNAFITLADGTQVPIPNPTAALVAGGLAGAGIVPGVTIPAFSSLNDQTSPQYLTVNLQTGIAEGTLLLASFRWTDWSVLNSVVNTIVTPGLAGGPPTTTSSYQPYNWRDGYTASVGIGRAFNEQVSGAISLGYDRGVSTGSDTTYTDLYTLSGGLSLRGEKFGEIRFGGLVGYWTDGEQKISDGAYFNATVGDDWVYAGNISLNFTF